MAHPNKTTRPAQSTPSSDTAHLFLTEVKKRALEEKGRVDYRKLRRDGYSESTIAQLKQIRPAS